MSRPHSVPLTLLERVQLEKEDLAAKYAEQEKRVERHNEELQALKDQVTQLLADRAHRPPQSHLRHSGTDSPVPQVPPQSDCVDGLVLTPQPPDSRPVSRPGGGPAARPRQMAAELECQQLSGRAAPLPTESSSLVKFDKNFVLFGGTNGQQLMNTTWVFHTAYEDWRKANCRGDVPLGRYGHSAVVYRKCMWIYGGYGLGGVAPAAPEPSKPEPLSSVMMGYGKQWADGERGYTRVTCGLLNSMYVLDFGGMTWQHVQHIQNGADGTPHHVKNHSAMVYGHKMYIFGGCTLEGRTNIVKAYDLDTYRWIPDHLFNPQLMAYAAGLSPAASLADVPCPRSGHTATLYRDPQAGPCMLVFGGRAAKAAYCNDLYAYYLQSHTWQRLQPSGNKPAPRAGHSALLYRNTLVVFGGYSGGTRDQKVYYNGIHLLNLATMVWSKAAVTGHTLPQPRCGHVAGLYDAPNRSVRMLLYGGWGVMAAPGPDVAAPRPQTPGDLPPEFAPPTICAPNNDSFAVVLAASVTPVSLKGKSLLPRISAPKGEPNSGEDNDSASLNKSSKPQTPRAPPKPFSVSTSPRVSIPWSAPTPRTTATKALGKKQIEEVVTRLADMNDVRERREKLEEKYMQQPQAAKLTGQELEESVERLYYHERQKQKDRQANLTQKWIRQEASKVLDEDQMLEMVDRLTAAPPPREIIVEPAATLTRPQLEAVVDRLYTQELTKREATNKRLQEKYIG